MPNRPTTLLGRLRPRALGAWLALAFILLSIVLTVLLVALIEHKAAGQVESSIGHGLAELAMQTSDKLERGMYERYREVGLLAQRRGLRPAAPAASRRAALDQVQSGYGFYSWIGIAGMDGRVQVAAHGLLEGADVSKRPWFHMALQGRHVAYPGRGWTVMVRQEAIDAYAPVRRLREYGLAAGVLMAALCSIAGLVVARRITAPLHALARAAQRIRAGETARIAPAGASYDE